MRNRRKLFPPNCDWRSGFLHCLGPRPAALARQRKRTAISNRLPKDAGFIEGAVGRIAGDKIAGAPGIYLKLRAERKLGGRAGAVAPHLRLSNLGGKASG